MSKPSMVFVPGFWEGPAVYETVAKSLRDSYGYNTTFATLPSTGRESPTNPSLQDDVRAVHACIEPLVENGEDVLLVLHSASGFIGTEALKDLTRKERESQSKKGGVFKVVFLTAGVFPAGFVTGPLPFFDYQDNRLFCKEPATLLFSGVPEALIQSWLPRIQCQPASGWDGEITHCGYKDVSSVYLLCENDRLVPLAMQQMCAATAGSKTQSCDAGHMVMLSHPEKVVDVIHRAAEGLL